MTRGQKLRAAVAALALTCVLVPASGQADADTTPPVLVALALPASVATGPGGVDVPVAARITDDLSGVAASDAEQRCGVYFGARTQITARSPAGGVAIANFVSRGGDDYSATLELPPYAHAGTWTVSSMFLIDCAQNIRTLVPEQLAELGLPTSFEVTGQGDETPPVLFALALAPTSVDVSLSSAEVTFTARLTDDLSGVAATDGGHPTCDGGGLTSGIYVRGPSGIGAPRRAGFVRRSGDDFDATLVLPRFAAAGTWTVSSVQLIDCTRNVRNVSANELLTSGFPVSFEVTGVSDGGPPELEALSITPSVVDTRAAGADVVFAARITDDLSGVSALDVPAGCSGPMSQVGVESPSGAIFTGFFRLRGGDDYEATVHLPRLAEAGTWKVLLILVDCVGHTRHVSADELAVLGLPGSFRVLPPEYEFGGFFAPLDADALARRHPGSAMAVKFRLGGAEGTDIFEPGFPQVQPIDCATRQPLGDAASLGPAEWVFQSLTDGVYQYKWKSSHDWRNVCRRLIVGFDDGSRHTADVHFK